jgi:hypothetical protein
MAWTPALFGAAGLRASAALFVSGCVATLDDDFEIVAAEDAGTAADAGATSATGNAKTSAADAGAGLCNCKPGSICLAGLCVCALTTPRDCGKVCAQCCSDSDCPGRKQCEDNRCQSDH